MQKKLEINLQKLRWGLIGGGEGSQIGFTHRAAAQMDANFYFDAGALDINPKEAIIFGKKLGLSDQKSYGSWQEMLEKEKILNTNDRLDLVTVATPNSTHFEITKSFLLEGFNVLCEKPITITVEEAKELEKISKDTGKICAVNYGYSGYPLVRQMRSMVLNGDLGDIRVVFAEFAGGFMADSSDEENPRVKWRFSAKHAGMAAISIDCGIHAINMACFVTDKKVIKVSSDFFSGIKSRELEDDNLTSFRMEGDIAGRLWTSGLAIGRTHGLTLQVFGSKGGLSWKQEQPNQLFWTPLNEYSRIIERGHENLYESAKRSNKITIGHPEGMIAAFSNIYKDLFDVISARKVNDTPNKLALTYPSVKDGCHSLEIVRAMKRSVSSDGCWTKV